MQLALHPIERFELFSLTCETDDDLTALKQIEIEGVGRMAHLHQRVVGRVSSVIDAVVVFDQQAFENMLWRFFNAYVANDSSRVSRAELAFGDLDREWIQMSCIGKMGRDRLQIEVIDR